MVIFGRICGFKRVWSISADLKPEQLNPSYSKLIICLPMLKSTAFRAQASWERLRWFVTQNRKNKLWSASLKNFSVWNNQKNKKIYIYNDVFSTIANNDDLYPWAHRKKCGNNCINKRLQQWSFPDYSTTQHYSTNETKKSLKLKCLMPEQ